MRNNLRQVIDSAKNSTSEIRQKFLERLGRGNFTRDEEPETHFCVYFLPYNEITKEVFLVHHKKANLWISPGGHIDKGETPVEALEREIKEELGVSYKASASVTPFLLTITLIDNIRQICKAHYDIWYLMPTDGSDFNVDLAEFHETRWLTIREATKLVTEPSNIEALGILKLM